MQSEFEKLDVKIAVISVDDVKQHNNWKLHLENMDYKGYGLQTIKFPIFEDPNGLSSMKYGMIHEAASTSKNVRGVYILDSKNVVRSINFYPMEIGRNMNEIVRIVEALQTTEEEYVSTPVNIELSRIFFLIFAVYKDQIIQPMFNIKMSQNNISNWIILNCKMPVINFFNLIYHTKT